MMHNFTVTRSHTLQDVDWVQLTDSEFPSVTTIQTLFDARSLYDVSIYRMV
jgi:hypothetical protein